MPIKNNGKRKRGQLSSLSKRKMKIHSRSCSNHQAFAVNHLNVTKSLDLFVSIGQLVLQTPLPVNDSPSYDMKKLRAIWNYSKQEDSDLEHASLQIVTLDNDLIFEKQVTQLCDQDPSSIMIQRNNSNNNNSSSSGDTNHSTHQKLFAHLARLCVNNFIVTSNISLDINNAIGMDYYVATLTLASDTEKFSVRRQLFYWVFPYLYPVAGGGIGSSDSPMPMDDFYRHLQPPVSKRLLKKCLSHELEPMLTPFQSQNVEWMVQKEGFSILDDGSLQAYTTNRDQLPYLWEKVAVTATKHIYINRVTQVISSSWSPQLENLRQQMYRGGILADEMGLGKTVSTIALILLHNTRKSDVYQRINIPGLKKTGATLIITPSTIIHQWESEFKRHAPGLRVAVYSGIKSMPPFMETEDMVEFLSSNDVVLASYDVLKSEIYYAREVPDRSRRLGTDTQPKVTRSPLIQILWWRCVVDEAQEVEAIKGLVTEMANLIPRHYSWGVTGTPIKSTNYDDLYGLLRYLGIIGDLTLASYQQLYTTSIHRQHFLDMTKMTIRRNMKSLLQDQVYIPTQHRHVINISFSAIERQYYNDLCVLTQEESDTVWLDSIGWRKPEDTSSPDYAKFVESTRALRKQLYTLRETCVYPARTGKSRQDVQSLDQVLKLMIQTTLDKIDEAEIGLANCKLTYGGMHELINNDWKSPLSIYLDWTPHVEEMVKVHSAKLDEAKQLSPSHRTSNAKQEDEFNAKGPETKTIQLIQMTLTTWQNILHRYYFYTAGVYHMLEENDKENSYYEMAADVRRQILVRPLEKVKASMKEIKNMDTSLAPERLSVSFCPQKETLLLTDDFLSHVDQVAETMNQQMNVILEWRGILKKMLTSDLVDSNEDDIQGDEYSNSLVIQKKCDMYQDLYQDILRDRHYLVNGVWQAPRVTSNNEDTAIIEDDADLEELKLLREKLEKTRQALTPDFHGSDNMRHLVTELREIASRANSTYKVEIHLVQQELTRLGRETKQQKDVQELLELEYRKLSALSNHRIEYYRALQQISDHVETWESRNPQQAIMDLEGQMNDYTSAIREQNSRWRYLQNIAKEEESTNGADKNKEMFCLICNEYFTRGIVTQCGHVYCRICADIWFKTSRRCPQCSATVGVEDRYPIFSALATLQQVDDQDRPPSGAVSSSGLSNDTLRQIARVPIVDGLGAKFDSVIRHIKYIQETNNGKCLVFSQWNRLLGILADGLKRNGIGHVNLVTRKQDDSIEKFRSDPSINVMLMHSRSHSSGLTLLEAKTVFILEPVLNESLEKQAIGRVHRIGQTEETSVFWYIVRDTIEEKIQAIHNEKERHRQIGNGIELESTPKPVLVSQSDGGGEFVSDDDLQKCFT